MSSRRRLKAEASVRNTGRIPRRWIAVVLVFVVLAAVGLITAFVGTAQPPSADLLKQAREEFRKQKYSLSEKTAASIPSDSPEYLPAMIIAGDSAARQKRFEEAITFYQQIPEDSSTQSRSALLSLGLVHRELGHAAESEEALRKLLARDPKNLEAHNAMAHLLGVSGRSWEAVPHLLEPVRQSQFSIHHLLLLGSSAPIVQDPKFVDRCMKARPENLIPLIGHARHILFEDNRVAEARSILERVLKNSPEQTEAQVRLGWILLEAPSKADFLNWHQQLGDRADSHPEMWVLRGTWAQRNDQHQEAVRCFAEALSRDPDHQTACFQMGLELQLLKMDQQAEPFRNRGALLTEFGETVAGIRSNGPTHSSVRKAAELAEKLGRFREAWGWSRLAQGPNPEQAWATEVTRRVQPHLTTHTGKTSPEANPLKAVQLPAFPLPKFPIVGDQQQFSDAGTSSQSSTVNSTVKQSAKEPSGIAFHDVSAEVGLQFRYFNGAEAAEATGRMYEFTGGGAASLDYDGDHWPDILLTQGSSWPPNSAASEKTDQLYRNLSGQKMTNVTSVTGLREPGFSQGVTAGDYNHDGFVDLYVANIGQNRFFRNNGDGTFSDVTTETDTGGDGNWTTSCLLTDLNGDRLPDLYTVGYLAGDDVFTRVCPQANGIQAGCGPEHFSGSPDQIFLNQGDGRFEESKTAFADQSVAGKGMGILAADLSATGQIDLFVANDAMANFFYSIVPPVVADSAIGGDILLSEHALASGLAFDWQGRPQAGMGVAGGDADGDGLADVFVTNYYREANTLYTQRGPGLFEDTSRTSGLAESSYLMLGFGTQFLDADLDGWNDLVVANGHVHNLTAAGIPWQMRPQFYHNQGHGNYVERKDAGDYFAQENLGRGLARLDWNRDHRNDFIVSSLYNNAALVENQTAAAGNSITVSLRGTSCSRDAIGAVIRIVADDRSWVHQLFAGDGYQACNERKLVIGLGSSRQADELQIRWPDGQVQTFSSIAAGSDIMLIQGRRSYYHCDPESRSDAQR